MFEQNKKQELTSRQKEILSLLRKGLTNNEICKTLGISSNTVKVHLANIYKILEVTNRTEAVSANIDDKGKDTAIQEDKNQKDLTLLFLKTNDISNYPNSHNLYRSIVDSMHHYHIFRIIDSIEKGVESGFTINISVAKDKVETLFISVKLGSSNEILWTTSINANTDNALLTAQRTAMQLFRSLILATAQIKYRPELPIPYWWYASSFCNVKMENRCKESFEITKKMLSPLVMSDNFNEQANYILSKAYYIAIMEKWGDITENATVLAQIARKAMFNAPYSIYSKMIMALYNTTIGNKSEAIAYLQQVIEENPLQTSATIALIQILILTGEEDKALQLIDKCQNLFPETATQASIYHARAFIMFLQGRYDECKKIAEQILLYTPKAMAVRLIMIACCNKKGELAESEYHVKQFYENNPSFTQKDIEQLLLGVVPQKKSLIMESLQNLFSR